MNRIDENHPSKFVDLQEKILFPIIPEELMVYLIQQGYDPQKEQELETANEIIEENPLTNDVTRKINEYTRDTDIFCKNINDCIPKLQKDLSEILSEKTVSESKTKKVAECINREIRDVFKNLRIKNFSALSKPKIYQSLQSLEDVAFQDIRKHLKSIITLEPNTFKLIQKAKSGTSIVNIEYSVEEQARMNKK